MGRGPATCEGSVEKRNVHRCLECVVSITLLITPAPYTFAGGQLFGENLLESVLQAHDRGLPLKQLGLLGLRPLSRTDRRRARWAQVHLLLTGGGDGAWASSCSGQGLLGRRPSAWHRLWDGLRQRLHLILLDFKGILVARAMQVPQHASGCVGFGCCLAAAGFSSEDMQHAQVLKFDGGLAKRLEDLLGVLRLPAAAPPQVVSDKLLQFGHLSRLIFVLVTWGSAGRLVPSRKVAIVSFGKFLSAHPDEKCERPLGCVPL
mmetsp:Transcript_12923/g.24392  ORF Transcript_12923/g.24392 Transcript_12923/m.24392 type:complete len:261 (+) Transcript_12923:180-962(+)